TFFDPATSVACTKDSDCASGLSCDLAKSLCKYDVTLTNPDGCSDTKKGAIQAVAGPVLFFVDPPVVFNGITTQVTLYTTGVSGTNADLGVTITNNTTGVATTLTSPSIDPRHGKRILVNIPKGQAK